MQPLETGKQNINELLAKYRPVGPRHLLAAALMQNARGKEQNASTKAYEPKAEKRTAPKIA